MKRYILDDEGSQCDIYLSIEINPSIDHSKVMTIGEYVENLLIDHNYFNTRLPRIPMQIDHKIQTKIQLTREKRKKKLILAARVPTSPDQARELGEDAAYWAEQKWIDFLTIAEFLYIRHELPVKPWRTQIKNIPLYASIEAWTPDPKGNDEKGHPTPDEYRREALHLWKEKVDGIYLFNFFTPREDGPRATEPAFFLLGELGDRKRLEELLKPSGR